MKKSVQEEVQKIIEEENLNCSIEEFQDEADWDVIESKPLSEDFIREFKDKLDWDDISYCQTLSENFIREFKNKVDWDDISASQPLSEGFIKEFKNEVNWCDISRIHPLSEDFIKEFKDKVVWGYISKYQPLSENFIKEFKNYINIKVQRKSHKKKSIEQKQKEAKQYAKKYNLKIDNEFLYAYRNHDKNGSGMFNKANKYKPGIYYRDWHCDMNKDNLISFGFGIWPNGNTKVKVKISDWGVSVDKNDGKARVWGFEIT